MNIYNVLSQKYKAKFFLNMILRAPFPLCIISEHAPKQAMSYKCGLLMPLELYKYVV